MAKTELSIIIVNYNAGQRLRRCLQSIEQQGLQTQIIICDNASQDQSLEQAQAVYPQIECIKNERNLGFAAAVNQGLERAKADYILLLNPDCELPKGTLSPLLNIIDSQAQAGMLGCRLLNPDGSEQRGGRRYLPNWRRTWQKALGLAGWDQHQQPLPDQIIAVEAISGAFMLVKKQAVAEVGGMDEDYFLHFEDLDWCARFQQAGWSILFVPWLSVIHHQGHCSRREKTKVEWHKHRALVHYYQKHILSQRPSWQRWLFVFLLSGASYAHFLLNLPRWQWQQWHQS